MVVIRRQAAQRKLGFASTKSCRQLSTAIRLSLSTGTSVGLHTMYLLVATLEVLLDTYSLSRREYILLRERERGSL